MLVELTKVEMVDGSPTIGRIHVNPNHVVSIVEDNLVYHDLKEGLLKAGVHDQFSVSKVVIYNGGGSSNVLMIMGHPKGIQEKLNGKKQVLRG